MIEPLASAPRKPVRVALAALAALSAPILLALPTAAVSNAVQSPSRMSYVLFAPGSGSTTMSGSADDIRHAQSLRNGDEALLYVRQGGTAYVIRDAAMVRQARTITEPQELLGAQQGELGSRQAALGRRQAALGAEQARLGRLQAEASSRSAGELGRQQSALGRRQGALGQEQAALGRQQGALGREQARLARIAQERIRDLVADAIRRGMAQRVD